MTIFKPKHIVCLGKKIWLFSKLKIPNWKQKLQRADNFKKKPIILRYLGNYLNFVKFRFKEVTDF